MEHFAKALTRLRPGAIWEYKENKLIWLDENQSKPAQKEIQEEIQKIIDNKPAEQVKQEIYTRLAEIDKEAIRPTRSIKVTELQGKEPNQFDVDKLIELENEADTLREKLKGL